MWAMKWFGWWWVFKSDEESINTTVCDPTVEGSIPVFLQFIVFAEHGDEVVCMFFAVIFYAQVINLEGVLDWMHDVFP